MRHFAKRARSLVRSALVACVISSAAPVLAQEADPPDPPTVPRPDVRGRGSLVAPSAWLVLNTPVRKPIDLKVYGFYIGELGVPVAQVDVPIRAARFLTITPSYMGYRVPASGLNELTPEPGRFTDSYHEHQFRDRRDGCDSPSASWRCPSATCTSGGSGRTWATSIAIAAASPSRTPSTVGGRTVKPFASYEAFYERAAGWNRDRLWTGVTLPIKPRVLIQPSYMFESAPGSRDVHYLLFGLIVNTR